MCVRVPKVFLVMGGCYFTLQLIGLLMISEPTEEEVKEMTAQTEDLLDKSGRSFLS